MTPSEPIRPGEPETKGESPFVRLRLKLEEARDANLPTLTPEQAALSVAAYNRLIETPLLKLEENVSRARLPQEDYLHGLLDSVNDGVTCYFWMNGPDPSDGRFEEFRQNRKVCLDQGKEASRIIAMAHRYIFRICQAPAAGPTPGDQPK